jgi:hypothetical protein
MTLVAMVVFGVSLAVILALFILKRIELRRGARFVEGFRMRADERALDVKHVLLVCEWYIERTPFFVTTLARYGVHFGALSFARLARSSAEQAHRLADLVSHKHRFERKETKSSFLREVSVHPIRNSREIVPEVVPEVIPEVPQEALREEAPPVETGKKRKRGNNGKVATM